MCMEECDEESCNVWAEYQHRDDIAKLLPQERELVRRCLEILRREFFRTLPTPIAPLFSQSKGGKRRKASASCVRNVEDDDGHPSIAIALPRVFLPCAHFFFSCKHIHVIV